MDPEGVIAMVEGAIAMLGGRTALNSPPGFVAVWMTTVESPTATYLGKTMNVSKHLRQFSCLLSRHFQDQMPLVWKQVHRKHGLKSKLRIDQNAVNSVIALQCTEQNAGLLLGRYGKQRS